jgi:gliding motility-associated-like protein
MRKPWIILNLLLVAFVSQAQNPSVNFTATPVTGCAPLVVTFRDQTTGGATNWDWDLGNGQLSTQQNPVVVYSQPGTYTVKLVVRNATGIAAETKTGFITVYPSPTVSFSADMTTGCVPVKVNFSDLSSIPGGNITSWSWNFGDGTTSTEQNPTHTYASPGFYDVSLQVTSSTGCSASGARGRYVRIVTGSVAEFTHSPPTTCLSPLAVSFRNESSGPGNLSYVWDLGNGTSSTAANPSAVYNEGTYTVKLITNSDYGCSDTIQKTITLTNTVTRIAAPDTACLNVPVTFRNNSTPAPITSRWDFGDGETANTQNATHTYNVPGVYTVKLVNRYKDCTDSITKLVTIGPKPSADFSSDTLAASCKAPFTVNFKNLTPDATSWLWDFGDGTTSTEPNPSHQYNRLGSFDITLNVRFNGGCETSVTKPIFVKILEPVMGIKDMPAGGCVPFTFKPQSKVEAVDGIASYLWDFGDGTTSTDEFPTHIYTNPGKYDLKLTIVTNTGCTKDTVYREGVKVGTEPVVDFTASKFDVCGSESVQFTDLSNPSDGWLWVFGDGETSEERNPVHIFRDTGLVTIIHTAINNGCSKTVIKSNYIRVKPPVADMEYVIDCANKRTVRFTDLSILDPNPAFPTTYLWEFGDPGGSTSNLPNPQFTYPALGSYNVRLTVTQNGCSYTIMRGILLAQIVPVFTASKTTFCRNETIRITSQTPQPENIREYIWNIGTLPAIRDTLPYIDIDLADTGRYNVRLTIVDTNMCTETVLVSDYLRVTGPIVDFVPDAAGTCPGKTMSFTDRTFSSLPITSWTWSFGDGTQPQTFTAPPFTHRYDTKGLYTVSLTVKDAAGCSHTKTIQDTVIITKPTAGFFADTIYCPDADLPFTDTSAGDRLTYFWTFGDGNSSTVRNPVHRYPASDNVYSVFLRVTDEFGCADSVAKPSYIKIRSPKAAFSVVDTTSLCPPLESRFTFEGKDQKSYYWDFGDGSSQSFVPNPRHFYNGYSVFTASLITLGYGGCADTATHNITVSDPGTTRFNFDPLTACNSLLVNFDVKPPAYSRFTFFFGDGVVSESQDTSFSHFYRGPAFFYPNMLLADSNGCIVPVGGPATIMVIGAKPLFGADKKAFCDSGGVAFSNFTIFNDPVVRYTWNFGDGSTSNDFNPSHYYPEPGVKLVSLTAETQAGCSDVLVDTIRVYRTPTASILSPDTVCLNTPLLFRGALAVADTTTIKWEWNFGNGQTSGSRDATVGYTSTGNYLVNLRTSVAFGCADTTSKSVYVAPLPTATIDPELKIISGSGIIMPATYTGDIVSYNWTPDQRLSCSDCPNPYAYPVKTTKYKVTVTDRYGCLASDDVTIFVVCADKNLFLPNTFSPNSDGTNDVFYPRGTGLFNIRSLRIFNRWGEMVYERSNFAANNASLGWDGTYKGQKAPQDTYIYTVEIVCENSEVNSFKGNVTLIR